MDETKTQSAINEILKRGLVIIGCCMVMYHMFSAQYMWLNSLLHGNVSLSFSLVMVFLGAFVATKKKIYRLSCALMLILGVFATGYFHFEYDRLEMIVGFPEPMDVVVGIILILVIVEATRHVFGLILPFLALICVVYFFLGHMIPGPFGHEYFEPAIVIDYLSVGLTGVFMYLPLGANMLFLFVVFGAVLNQMGATQFVFEIGKWIGRITAGGIGQTCVIGSTLVGLFTGIGVANVAITGAFTIPLMKKAGYPPDTTAAIESTASNGAQLVPPVMGATAFLMAYMLNVDYVVIMIAGIIPGILYYASLFVGVEIIARKLKIAKPTEPVDVKVMLTRAPMFIIPIIVICALLLMRHSPMFAGFYSVLSIIVIAFLSKSTRPSLAFLAEALAKGAMTASRIMVSIGLVGILTQTMVTTGLGIKLGQFVETLAGGSMLILLILSMIACMILGTGLPPIAAYMIVAMVISPVVAHSGVPLLAAHMFVFYYACLGGITPPTAVCVVAAAEMAGGNWWIAGWKATRLALIGFLLPFLWIYSPELLGDFSHPMRIFPTLMATLLLIVTTAGLVYKHLYIKIPYWGMIFLGLSIISVFYNIVNQRFVFLGIAILLFLPVIAQQWIGVRRQAHLLSS